MRFWLKLGTMFLALFLIISCSADIQTNGVQDEKNNLPEVKNNVVAEFDGEKITSDEFESAFQKVGIAKQQNKADSLMEKKKFLELYVNYKMKLKDAFEKGLDKDSAVIKEYNDYRKSIGAGMLVEKEVTANGLKKLYERRKTEIRLKQIFVKLDSSRVDLGESRAEMILSKIVKGENFDDLVSQYSEDPNSKTSGGDLYYATAGEITVPGIEDAMYSVEVGQTIPRVFRSQFGFHLLKVTDKKNRVQGVKVRHIMAAYKTEDLPPDTAAAKKKILEAQNELKSGVSFESVAAKYSDDRNNAAKGGLLGVVARRQFLNFKSFEETVFNLKANEVSDIVQTQVGFHIIKVDEIIPLKSFSDEYESLKKMYENTAFKTDLDNYAATLKTELNYKLNTPVYNQLIAVEDSLHIGDSLFLANVRNKFKDSLLATAGNMTYTADSLFKFMLNSNEFLGKKYDSETVKDAQNKFITSVLLSEKAEMMLKNNPEFESIMEEYKNGILLFKVSENEVWNKVNVDSVMIKEYWEKTKDKYLTKPRVTYREIFFGSPRLRDSVYTALKAGADFDKELDRSQRANSDIPVTKYLDENPLAKKVYELKNVGDLTEPINNNGGWSILRLDKKEVPMVKTFDEAKPEVSSILQEMESKRLEENYTDKLRGMYKPKIYTEKIKN